MGLWKGGMVVVCLRRKKRGEVRVGLVTVRERACSYSSMNSDHGQSNVLETMKLRSYLGYDE